jgi:uncharacterized RmlC-like cupin family protein
MAEWPDPEQRGAQRIAASKEALAKAPATASRYEAKAYNFPSGSLRVLTFKKGGPVHHLIAFETEIYVLQGSATLMPLRSFPDKPVKVAAGDALFLPSGVLVNPKAEDDVVLIQAVVASSAAKPKKTIIRAHDARASGKTRTYAGDGNAIRVLTLGKGEAANLSTGARSDVLAYIVKGKLLGQAGDAIPGDAIREKLGTPGSWKAAEESVVVATDAPISPTAPESGWAAALHDARTAAPMRLFSMNIDHNGRSGVTFVNIPMQKLSDTESMSARQDGAYFRIGHRTSYTLARTSPKFESDGGPYEMHGFGEPHFVARLSGSTEVTMQDGSVFRSAAGDFLYVRPGCLHNSNQLSETSGVVMNMYTPGGVDDIGPLIVKG